MVAAIVNVFLVVDAEPFHKRPLASHGRKFQKRIKQLVAAGAYNGLL